VGITNSTVWPRLCYPIIFNIKDLQKLFMIRKSFQVKPWDEMLFLRYLLHLRSVDGIEIK